MSIGSVSSCVMTARAPYRIVRMHQGGLYFLACLEGEGRVFLRTLQVFPSSLDADCARVVAERFMEGAPE